MEANHLDGVRMSTRGLRDLVRGRRSNRSVFDSERKVPDAALLRIVEAARWAPTAHNMQNFDLVVVDDPTIIDALGMVPTRPTASFLRENYLQLSFSEDELRRREVGLLADAFPPAWRAPQPDAEEIARSGERGLLHDCLRGSPTLIVVTYDTHRRAPDSEHDFLGAVSLGCVLENMWLTATELDIDFQVISSIAGAEAEGPVKKVLAMPPSMRIAFGVRLGYAREHSWSLRVRRSLERFVHRNGFRRR